MDGDEVKIRSFQLLKKSGGKKTNSWLSDQAKLKTVQLLAKRKESLK